MNDAIAPDRDTELRAPTESDAEECGRIVYEAFNGVSDLRSFPPEFPSVEAATGLIAASIGRPAVFGVVAERDGRIVGSNFLDERDPIRGVGPITVDPSAQTRGVGRRLMQAVIERGRARRRACGCSRMPTTPSPCRSTRRSASRPASRWCGSPGDLPEIPRGHGHHEVRPLEEGDLEACESLCADVHGFPRTNELRDAMAMPMLAPLVAVRDGRVRAYASSVGFWQLAHGVAETEADMTALLLGARAAVTEEIDLLLPIREASLFRWCLTQGLRVVKPMTLMTLGAYQEPRGSWFPSVEY